MPKRTKAQRSAAAKASWERRRKGLPPLVAAKKRRKGKARNQPPTVDIETVRPTVVLAEPEIRYITPPRITYAVREGDNIFICFGQDGSLNRERVDESGARKLLRELTAILV